MFYNSICNIPNYELQIFFVFFSEYFGFVKRALIVFGRTLLSSLVGLAKKWKCTNGTLSYKMEAALIWHFGPSTNLCLKFVYIGF